MNPISLPTQTMSSREIAALVEVRHDNVRRTIETLASKGVITLPQFEEVSNDGPGPKTVTVYRVGKRDSYVIVAQLSPEFTARLVDRWQELEAAATPMLPRTMAQALRLAAEQAEQIEQQQAQLQAARPAVEFVESFVNAEGLKGFREVCKLLKANEARFREFVIAKRIMYVLAGKLTAFQQHLDAGRFEIRAGLAQEGQHAYTTSKFTPKGLEWVAGEWAKYQLQQEVHG